jgi:hypothetical protein
VVDVRVAQDEVVPLLARRIQSLRAQQGVGAAATRGAS